MKNKNDVLATIPVDYAELDSASSVDVVVAGKHNALFWRCNLHDLREWCRCLHEMFDMRLEAELVHNSGHPFQVPIIPELDAWAHCVIRQGDEPREVVCLDTLAPEEQEREALGWLYPNEGVRAVQLLLFDRVGAVVQAGLPCPSSAHDFKEATYITKLLADKTMRREAAVEAWHIMTKGFCTRCAPFHDFENVLPDDLKSSPFGGKKNFK